MTDYFKSQIRSNQQETVEQLAADFASFCSERLNHQPKIFIALSGGSTPQLLFTHLANEYADKLDWQNVHFFWVDERLVPFTSAESNFGVANRLLFSKIEISEANLHPIRFTPDPDLEVQRYSDEIKALVPLEGACPVFDIILLGMGDDGHTASIFPGQLNLFDVDSISALSTHPVSGQKRITLTGNVLNQASQVLFLVTGPAKAPIIKSIFENSSESEKYPAKKVQPVKGKLSWYLDVQAGKDINL